MPDSLSALYALKLAIKSKIETLIANDKLPGLETATIKVRKVPGFMDFGNGKAFAFPGIVISNPQQGESDVPVLNQSQDRIFSVMVAIALQETSTDYDELMSAGDDERLAWRDVLIDNLVPKGIRTTNPVLSFYKSELGGGQVVDWNQFVADKRWVSSFNFRFWQRRPHQN